MLRVGDIRVRSAVLAVHQPRLRGKIQFAQGAHTQVSREGFRKNKARRRHERPQERIYPFQEFRRGMASQQDALARGLGTYQAGSRRKPQTGPIDLGTIRTVDIHIQQARGGVFGLDAHSGPFGLNGWQVGRRDMEADQGDLFG